jgi:hypothetical protein
MAGDPRVSQKLLEVKDKIVANFTEADWQNIGLISNGSDVVNSHPRLLRSMRFNDDDYESSAVTVLTSIVNNDLATIIRIADYVDKKFGQQGEYVSSLPSEKKILFAPNVFKIPEGERQRDLVAVMMPFSGFNAVETAIKNAATKAGFKCIRVDDIWEDSTIIQDIFSLIYKSHIVVSDFSNKNPNVLYETGIAHCLGRTVVPITRNIDDVPSDLRHHRALVYLPNEQGLDQMETELAKRLRSLMP